MALIHGPFGALLTFLLAAVAIAVFGARLSELADRFADRTGLGEAVIGALVLGAMTSLPGIVATADLALAGRAAFAVSSAVGGIAVQTAFLAVADLVYRRANLEHAAASLPNLMFGGLLLALLSLLMLAMSVPGLAILQVHPLTAILPVAYVAGLVWVRAAREEPMWRPRITHHTREDRPDREAERERLVPLLLQLLVVGVVVGFAGWCVARAAPVLAAAGGLNDSLVGGTLVAVSTSLPELVTAVAAVRQGALTLAVGGILGGNAFDTLFVAVADVAYREGPITAAITDQERQLVAVSAVMTSVLLLGLMRRERSGPANVGVETVLVTGLYGLGLVLLARG